MCISISNVWCFSEVLQMCSHRFELSSIWLVRNGNFSSVQFSSVAQSCLTLRDPMNRSMPGLPVHHQLLEFTQTHVHWVSVAIQPSHPLSSPSPRAPNPSQHQSLFQWVNSSHEVAKVREFQLQHHSLQRNPRADLLQNGLVGSPCSPRDSQESTPTPQFKWCCFNLHFSNFEWVEASFHMLRDICVYLWIICSCHTPFNCQVLVLCPSVVEYSSYFMKLAFVIHDINIFS